MEYNDDAKSALEWDRSKSDEIHSGGNAGGADGGRGTEHWGSIPIRWSTAGRTTVIAPRETLPILHRSIPAAIPSVRPSPAPTAAFSCIIPHDEYRLCQHQLLAQRRRQRRATLQMYGNLYVGGVNTAQSARYYLNTPLANTWQQYIVPLSASAWRTRRTSAVSPSRTPSVRLNPLSIWMTSNWSVPRHPP